MDYRNYPKLMERYYAISTLTVGPDETKDSLIKKLMDNSYEKKQISLEANAIIKEYVTKYEKDPSLLDADAVAMLEDFLSLVMTKFGRPIDLSIALQIARLLLAHYQAVGDLEKIVYLMERCATFDILMRGHTDDFESTPYSLMAEQYLDDFDRLSDKGKQLLVRCWTFCVLNEKDKVFVLEKICQISERFAEFRRKMGSEFMRGRYLIMQSNALEMVLNSCLEADYAERCGIKPARPVVDLEQYGPILEKFGQEQAEVFAREEEIARLDLGRVYTRICLARLDYHLGKITVEELLDRLKSLSRPQSTYDAYEQCNALFMANTAYLEYLYKCSNFDRQYVMDKGRQVIQHVLDELDGVTHDLGPILGAIHINNCIINFMKAASSFIEFDMFKTVVLGATVFADKALYVHTMIVKEISLVILDYILEYDPRYLDGVAGYDWEYCRTHKQEIMDLMENCALFHDIGKYFCLDVVSNSSRSLTDDEFEVIKYHPLNFSNIYHGGMSPAIRCIRDCAEEHHRWYNEEGGYPRKVHTFNKPLVNILTIADCIDAATDNIGRPYGLGKTFEQVRAEFDRDRDTRYNGYISELLHVEEIQKKIEYIIDDRRKDIYCDIYLNTIEKVQ